MRLEKSELLRLVASAASLTGVSLAFWGDPSVHPFRIVLSMDGRSQRFLLYIWNITHGGGAARATDEYRIQVTGVQSIDVLPGATTLILGYYEAANVFAGWDGSQHDGPVASSPSLQVRESALLDANINGISVYPKNNDGVVVCASPPFLTEYAFTSPAMHGYTTSDMQAAVSSIIAADPEVDVPPHQVPEERGRVLRTQAELHRAHDFRYRVLAAYRNTCAVSRTQLRLVDAAHILPVSVDGSHDGTPNGLCLEAAYHRAFDQGLLVVLPDYTIALDTSKVKTVSDLNLAGGY
jgi:putative restriction endonuclease